MWEMYIRSITLAPRSPACKPCSWMYPEHIGMMVGPGWNHWKNWKRNWILRRKFVQRRRLLQRDHLVVVAIGMHGAVEIVQQLFAVARQKISPAHFSFLQNLVRIKRFTQ